MNISKGRLALLYTIDSSLLFVVDLSIVVDHVMILAAGLTSYGSGIVIDVVDFVN